MKKYVEYLKEITACELYDGLVGDGLFAEKIPNFLTSSKFLEYSKNLEHPIESNKNQAKDYIRYSSMRNINIPRQMAIPEPFAYSNLCHCLSKNWKEIQEYFELQTSNQNHKISRIHLRKLEDCNALFEMNYKNYRKDGSPEQELIIKSRYIVSADISNFFPSIYSHSIPWALKGKEEAKKKTKKKELWFNQLDDCVQRLKYGETNGVLIGPHASNLISEIILAKVDNFLTSKKYRYIRNVDDYTCYVPTYEDAERFLVDLSSELKKYELCLNNKKTKIDPLPQASVENWVGRLNDYIFVNTYQVNGREGLKLKELKSFIDYVIQLFLQEDKNSAILNYAIKIIANKHLGVHAKSYYLNQIHHLVLLFPYLIHLLDNSVFKPHKVSQEKIKDIAKDIYMYGKEKQFYEANSYAIFWALEYEFSLEELDRNLRKEAKLSEDVIFLLLAFLYDKKNGSKITGYKQIARGLNIHDFDRFWLLIYEVLPSEELPKHFRQMKQKSNISFVKDKFR